MLVCKEIIIVSLVYFTARGDKNNKSSKKNCPCSEKKENRDLKMSYEQDAKYFRTTVPSIVELTFEEWAKVIPAISVVKVCSTADE